MAEILFVTWDGGGNVPPALALANEVAARGHGVRVMGHPQQRATVEAAGLTFHPFPTARQFDSTAENSPPTVVRMFGDRAMGRDVLAELETAGADLVVVDCLLFGALEAVRTSGQRYVVLEHFFDKYLRGHWLKGPLGIAIKAARLAPLKSYDQAEHCLVATLAELDPASGKGRAGNLVYTGPMLSGTPAHADEPTILVSLSTFNFPGQTPRLQRVMDACGGLDGVRVIVTTGPVIDPADLHPSANTEVHRWVPHAELLPKCSLVIGHGGHATTMAALAHDLPLLVLPSHPLLDQTMVGKAVEQAGAGRLMSAKASAEQLLPVIRELLGDGAHRAGAARLGTAIRNAQGAAVGADALEKLVSNGQPRATA